MAADHPGDVDLSLGVVLDGYATPVVVEGDGGVGDVKFDFDDISVGVVDLVGGTV